MLSDLKMKENLHRPVKFPINGYNAFIPASHDSPQIDPKVYQQFIGNITYAMTTTRPDITFAINKLAQYMSDPADYHQSSIKHLTRYLRSIKNMEI
jgi:hypothetical protein